jgi:hypothetical protein
MNSKLYCKILAVGIIVLSVGVSVSSGFAVETKHSIVTEEVEEDCGCEDKTHNSQLCDLIHSRFEYNLEIVWYFARLAANSTSIGGYIFYLSKVFIYYAQVLLFLNIWYFLGCDEVSLNMKVDTLILFENLLSNLS